MLLGVQIAFGFVNLAFLAPVWMQLLHLLNADLLWVALVVLTAASIAAPRSRSRSEDDDAARERRAQRVASHLEPVARGTE